MAGGCPAPACAPSCTARPAQRRPRPPAPPRFASRLPAAASHTRMPPAARRRRRLRAAGSPGEREALSRGPAEPGVPRRRTPA